MPRKLDCYLLETRFTNKYLPRKKGILGLSYSRILGPDEPGGIQKLKESTWYSYPWSNPL
ncbi:MAG TPA: hypothetical protein VEY10_05265 [Flavisolibacter sp.]|jgi:hypothetical protein|nr:hypothetical protein [Flavisolibacter sp.]